MPWIKKTYFYLVSLISLVIVVIGAIGLLNLALKQWVFTRADRDFYYPPRVDCARVPETDRKTMVECAYPNFTEEEKKRQQESRQAQKQREAASYIAMIVVAVPVFYFHFKWARREN